MPTVVCNSGPLIALAKLNRLDLLSKLWDTVCMTRRVYYEVVTLGEAMRAQDARVVRLFWDRQRWPVVHVDVSVARSYVPQMRLDSGERETLAYALSQTDAIVLLDDLAARQEARRLGMTVKGTLGVIADTCRHQLLGFTEAELLIREIEGRPDIWIQSDLCKRVLEGLREEGTE